LQDLNIHIFFQYRYKSTL